MKQIKIKSVDELIEFIETTELKFDKYLEIVEAYCQCSLIWVDDNKKTSEQLILRLKEMETNIELGFTLPLILDIEMPDIGNRKEIN